MESKIVYRRSNAYQRLVEALEQFDKEFAQDNGKTSGKYHKGRSSINNVR